MVATDLIQIVDSAMDEAARRSGHHLACYRGCAVCCFGPFPITQADAERLRVGLAQSSPILQNEVRARASAAVAQLRVNFPGDATAGALHLGPDEEASFAARHAHLPCPALSPESGACVLYEHRPVACRTYGPPLRLNGESLPPCPLCFKRATPEEVELARTTLDLPEEDDPRPRTLIAYALL